MRQVRDAMENMASATTSVVRRRTYCGGAQRRGRTKCSASPTPVEGQVVLVPGTPRHDDD